MKLFELFKMALANQFQRPLRTLLNLFGITLGAVVFIMTAAGGSGVRDAFVALFNNSEMARRVRVHTSYDDDYSQLDESLWKVSETVEPDRRERLEKRLKAYHGQRSQQRGRSYQAIDQERLQRLKQIPGVTSVVPSVGIRFGLKRKAFHHILYGNAISPHAVDLEERIVAGDIPGRSKNEIMLHEIIAYEMGYHTLKELESLIGQTVTLQFHGGSNGGVYFNFDKKGTIEEIFQQQLQANAGLAKLIENADSNLITEEQRKLLQSFIAPSKSESTDEAPVVEITEQFTVAGVYRSSETQSAYDLFSRLMDKPSANALLQQQTAEDLYRRVYAEKADFHEATLTASSYKDLGSIEDEVKSLGLSAFSARRIFESVENDIERVCKVVNYVALGILAITAIGISNTLIISVLERTPEFGIMKALGTSNHQILLLMLFEGFVLGAIGSILAIAISFLAAMFGDQFLQSYVEGQINGEFSSGLFTISWRAVLLACTLAISVCCAASIIPAWRAARLDPVVAMRQN